LTRPKEKRASDHKETIWFYFLEIGNTLEVGGDVTMKTAYFRNIRLSNCFELLFLKKIRHFTFIPIRFNLNLHNY